MKSYKKPVLNVERFTPDEFISACGDSGVNYLFKCDAHAGTLYYYPNSDGNIDGTYEGGGRVEKMGSYTPCGATHDAPTTDDFYDGFVDRNRNGRQDSGEGVIVWRSREWGIFGPYWSGHATKNLDMDSWGTDKS